MSNQLLTAKQIAARLGVSLSTVRRWTREEVLPPPVRLGRLVRWSPETFEAWLVRFKITCDFLSSYPRCG